MRTALIVTISLLTNVFACAADGIQDRKRAFLAAQADAWRDAGYPFQSAHEEWKFDEIEPNWMGALGMLALKRTPDEMARANAYLAVMPLDEKTDPDMRVCEALHTYFLFRDDPDLSPDARRGILAVIRHKAPPHRVYRSIWDFHATENHAFMGHVWALLVAQLDRDRAAQQTLEDHVAAYIAEHVRKGWLEYNSPCYVEKELGCLVLVAEWAERASLRTLARIGLDVLFAEHAALQLEGMLCGPAARVYGDEPIDEPNHNSRRDAACAGSYACMWMLFGQGGPHPYGVLGAPLLATSRYEPPRAIAALVAAGEARGSYVFRARRPGFGLAPWRHQGAVTPAPPPTAFNLPVYTLVTPDYVLGSFQEVHGRYGAVPSAPLSAVLRMKGSTRRCIYIDLLPAGRIKDPTPPLDCVQHENVVLARGTVGRAYLAKDEFDETLERDGWIFARAGETFAALRVVDGTYTWENVRHPSMYGDFIRFAPDAFAILEAARAADYEGGFAAFMAGILDNRIERAAESLTYESGPAARPFTVTLRPGQVPLVDGAPVDLEAYPTLDSTHVRSAWDSGVIEVQYDSLRYSADVRDLAAPVAREE